MLEKFLDEGMLIRHAVLLLEDLLSQAIKGDKSSNVRDVGDVTHTSLITCVAASCL